MSRNVYGTPTLNIVVGTKICFYPLNIGFSMPGGSDGRGGR